MGKIVVGQHQTQLDTEAIVIAQEALTKIDTHEAVCAKRWATALKLLITTAGGVFTILITMVGYLINYAIHLPHH